MATISLDAGQVPAAALELSAAPGRVEAALAPAQLGQVAGILDAAVVAAWSGPYAVALAAGTAVETSPDLAVVTGGSAGHLSGGATAGDLVFGVEYGGGRRVAPVRPGRRARAHQRRTTAQFHGQTLTQARAVEGAADRAGDALADHVATAVTP